MIDVGNTLALRDERGKAAMPLRPPKSASSIWYCPLTASIASLALVHNHCPEVSSLLHSPKIGQHRRSRLDPHEEAFDFQVLVGSMVSFIGVGIGNAKG